MDIEKCWQNSYLNYIEKKYDSSPNDMANTKLPLGNVIICHISIWEVCGPSNFYRHFSSLLAVIFTCHSNSKGRIEFMKIKYGLLDIIESVW